MNNGLMLHTMYYENEVRQVEQFGKTGGIELKEAELTVAHQLVEALADDFDPKKYHDTFEENVRKLIQARLEGKETPAVEKPRKLAPVVDLMAALKESLAQVPKKPAQRAAEAERPSKVTAFQRRAGRK
jgi:DNA end-binding protein Ku